MTYANFDAYRNDYLVCQNAAQAVHGVIPQTKSVDPTIGWLLYQNSLKPALGFQTFGRHITGDKAKELMKFRGKHPTAQLPTAMVGMNHSEKFFKNFGVVSDEKDGSILLMGGGKWNFTINDSWLLGGINGKNDFYAASPIVKKISSIKTMSFRLLEENYMAWHFLVTKWLQHRMVLASFLTAQVQLRMPI